VNSPGVDLEKTSGYGEENLIIRLNFSGQSVRMINFSIIA